MSDSDSQEMSYGEFARRLYATGMLSDPWLNGRERFRLQPVLLDSAEAGEFRLAAERIGFLYHELAEIVLDSPELLDEFFGLTPWQKAMWLASGGSWHGIARVDLFRCADGRIRSCEMNSDTPSGEAEAVLLNRMLLPFHPGVVDPNEGFDERFCAMLAASHQARLGEADAPPALPGSVAIIYPTDLPEDLSMIALYKDWLESRGCRVVLGSPFNLGRTPRGELTVLGEPVEMVVRHYKTDWWGEREMIWANQNPFSDPDPLERELSLLLEAGSQGRVTIVNPFGSVITQNKLAMALMWERRDLFSPQARGWIEDYLPETRRFDAERDRDLPREEWVLKSVYGCEGDSVVCGPFVKPTDWQLALTAAIPRHWVRQRFFEVAPTPEGMLPNYGVYLIGGRAAGFYTRLSARATDHTAVTAPTFIV
ncbi:MAG: glutathionylspermidine synthase family protein [Blastocatellia bacterium]|nr:glutathionylspermidine synthase family protein [Blastocatellia bacterium]